MERDPSHIFLCWIMLAHVPPTLSHTQVMFKVSGTLDVAKLCHTCGWKKPNPSSQPQKIQKHQKLTSWYNLSWDSTKYMYWKKIAQIVVPSNCNRLLLNEWILHDIIFPRDSNTREIKHWTPFFFLNGTLEFLFVFDFVCHKNSVLPTCPSCHAQSSPDHHDHEFLGKIYSFVLWVCLLSWTYLKLPLSAKVHSQSCWLDCIHRGLTHSPSWPECITLCLDYTLLVPIFFRISLWRVRDLKLLRGLTGSHPLDCP
jgi:hypothetical protein